MPDYIWNWLCHNELDDGEYKFAEGTVTIKDGWASWKEN